MTNLIKLSVSKSKTYSDCAKKFNYIYNLKLPRREFEYHALGKFIHSVLELFHLSYINGNNAPQHQTMGRIYKQIFTEYKDKLSKESQTDAYNIINCYLKKLSLHNNEDKTHILAVEKSFNISLTDNIVLTGMIDRVQRDPDGILHVIDYKTSKSKRYLSKDFFQLETYAYALCQEDPTIKRVRGSYIMLRLDCEYITKDFSFEEIAKVKSIYEDYAKSIGDDTLWEAKPSKLCGYCEFLPLCEVGKAFMTKDIKHGATSW